MSKTVKNEDAVPEAYPYFWDSENSNISVEEFVKKYKPSMVQNDGTKPWLWVQNSNAAGSIGNREAAIEEATGLLDEVTKRIQKINDDDTIPVRSNKKTGTKSKKQLKEEIQAEYTGKLRDVHKKHEHKSGKWLVFVAPDAVDSVWSRIAISVATGPLSKTSVDLAKVATTPPGESSAQRLICIYIPDVFDKEKLTEVMRILLRNHGVNLSGVKSNLYTEIGLDSKHSSHIPSTVCLFSNRPIFITDTEGKVWRNTDLLNDSQIKELKEAFYTDLKAGQKKTDTDSEAKKPSAKPKSVEEDDPFASSEDEDPSNGAALKEEIPTAKRKSKDNDERPKKKTK